MVVIDAVMMVVIIRSFASRFLKACNVLKLILLSEILSSSAVKVSFSYPSRQLRGNLVYN